MNSLNLLSNFAQIDFLKRIFGIAKGIEKLAVIGRGPENGQTIYRKGTKGKSP